MRKLFLCGDDLPSTKRPLFKLGLPIFAGSTSYGIYGIIEISNLYVGELPLPFPDSVKLEARRKAHFMCVACHAPFVEVHHIIPEAEKGPDILDNAAPLCAGCHKIYGGNPDFRKQIRQMRDNWYDVCEKRFGPLSLEVPQQLNAMGETLRTMRSDQVKYQKTLNEIKSTIVDSLAGTASAIKSAQTLEEVVTASGYPTTGVYLGPDVYANFKCRNCGTIIGLLVGNHKCPTCGTPIKS